MSVFEELGPLALASRLKQLSETLSKEVARIYQEQGIPFEPRWFTLFWTLHKQQALTISELAGELRQTHAAAVQLTQLLEKKGLLVSHKDRKDERRRRVSLSAEGQALFKQVEPVLQAIEQANRELILTKAPDFMEQLLSLEKALEEQPMFRRIMERLQLNLQGFRVESYTTPLKNAFREFQERLAAETSATLPAPDRSLWEQPEEIAAQGGRVFIALHDNRPTGSAAIIPEEREAFRLLYLFVDPPYQGKGTGGALLEEAMKAAQAKGARQLTLRCSPSQSPYLNFFIKRGFLFTPATPAEQGREVSFLKLSVDLPPSS